MLTPRGPNSFFLTCGITENDHIRCQRPLFGVGASLPQWEILDPPMLVTLCMTFTLIYHIDNQFFTVSLTLTSNAPFCLEVNSFAQKNGRNVPAVVYCYYIPHK